MPSWICELHFLAGEFCSVLIEYVSESALLHMFVNL